MRLHLGKRLRAHEQLVTGVSREPLPVCLRPSEGRLGLVLSNSPAPLRIVLCFPVLRSIFCVHHAMTEVRKSSLRCSDDICTV